MHEIPQSMHIHITAMCSAVCHPEITYFYNSSEYLQPDETEILHIKVLTPNTDQWQHSPFKLWAPMGAVVWRFYKWQCWMTWPGHPTEHDHPYRTLINILKSLIFWITTTCTTGSPPWIFSWKNGPKGPKTGGDTIVSSPVPRGKAQNSRAGWGRVGGKEMQGGGGKKLELKSFLSMYNVQQQQQQQ